MINMPKQGGGAQLIRQDKLLIWDEAPMDKRHTIETVDRSFRDIMYKDVLFGGKSWYLKVTSNKFCQWF